MATTVPKSRRELEQFLIQCVTKSVLARMFLVTPRTIENWRTRHGLPSRKIGGYRLFYIPDVLEWVERDQRETLKRLIVKTPPSERFVRFRGDP